MSDIWLKTSHFLTEIEKCIKDDLAETPISHLSITSIYILVALYKQDHQRPMDLATATNTAATSLTPTLDRLEAAGMIERGINKDDRRSILISLTAKGKQMRRPIENAIVNAEVRYGGK